MSHFLRTIQHLRHYEEILIFACQPDISSAEITEASSYLDKEYQAESLNFPFKPPAFEKEAAIWAAKTVYLTAQLIVYRKQSEQELFRTLPAFDKEITAGGILSADLYLRFLPQLKIFLHKLDPEDSIIPILDKILHRFPYAAVGTSIVARDQDLQPIVHNPCMLQLYTDRVIARADLKKALHPLIKPSVEAALGNHAAYFWNTFKIESNQTYATH